MCVSKCREGFEIIPFYNDMIRYILVYQRITPPHRFLNYGAAFDLFQDRKLIAQTLLYFLGLIFPNKAIGLVLTEKSEKCRAFIVRQSFQSLDALN